MSASQRPRQSKSAPRVQLKSTGLSNQVSLKSAAPEVATPSGKSKLVKARDKDKKKTKGSKSEPSLRREKVSQGLPPPRKLTTFEQLCKDLTSNQTAQKQVTLGKRIGFYRLREELGSGNFSQVKMGLHSLTRDKVAIKIIDKTKLDQRTQRLLSREISSMERLHHPNIIRLFEVVETMGKLHIVMEYADGGELYTKVTQSGRLNERDVKPLFAQVVAAAHHMHERHIVHRDIKAENVFLSFPAGGSGGGGSLSRAAVKVGDFGFSTLAPQQQRLNTFCGSPPYAAPELFKDASYVGVGVDVWAMGVLLFFMVTSQMPFRADTVAKLKTVILAGDFDIPSYVSDDCKTLIRSILRQNPEERITIKEMTTTSPFLRNQRFPSALRPFYTPGGRGAKELALAASHSVSESEGTASAAPLPSNRCGGSVAPPLHCTPSRNPDKFTTTFEDEENETRDILFSLGITEAHLRQVRLRDARSSVTGVFRIVLHRVQKRRMLMAESSGVWGDADAGSGSLGAAGYPRPKNPTTQTTPKSSPKFPKRSWGAGLGSPKLWSKMRHGASEGNGAGGACSSDSRSSEVKHSMAKSTGAVKRSSGVALQNCIKSKSTDAELNDVTPAVGDAGNVVVTGAVAIANGGAIVVAEDSATTSTAPFSVVNGHVDAGDEVVLSCAAASAAGVTDSRRHTPVHSRPTAPNIAAPIPPLSPRPGVAVSAADSIEKSASKIAAPSVELLVDVAAIEAGLDAATPSDRKSRTPPPSSAPPSSSSQQTNDFRSTNLKRAKSAKTKGSSSSSAGAAGDRSGRDSVDGEENKSCNIL